MRKSCEREALTWWPRCPSRPRSLRRRRPWEDPPRLRPPWPPTLSSPNPFVFEISYHFLSWAAGSTVPLGPLLSDCSDVAPTVCWARRPPLSLLFYLVSTECFLKNTIYYSTIILVVFCLDLRNTWVILDKFFKILLKNKIKK